MLTRAIILAAGQGTRMKSTTPKVLHTVLEVPLLAWVLDAAHGAGAQQCCVVVGHGADEVRACAKAWQASSHASQEPRSCDAFTAPTTSVICALQSEQRGTGDATKIGLEALETDDGCILVLYGDTPLLRPQTLKRLVEKVETEQLGAAVLSMRPQDPSGYGRIFCDEDGEVLAIIEDKDCTEEQRACLTQCNSGVYAFNERALRAHIAHIAPNNAQGEYYITDMIEILKNAGESVRCVEASDNTELLGINSQAQLAQAAHIMQARINNKHLEAGVSMRDPSLTWIGPHVSIEPDTLLEPMTFLWGNTHVGQASKLEINTVLRDALIGSHCTIGPNTRLTHSSCKDGCTVDETVAIDAVLENNVSCGPRAYLRPGTHLLDDSHAGTHIEIKNSTIGEGSQVPHLSYIGDTTMGSYVNVGAGSITCNYDGAHKHATHIGDDVFIGSNTMMVAPLSIGDAAVTAAGSVLTHDVETEALAIAREKQSNKSGWRKRSAMPYRSKTAQARTRKNTTARTDAQNLGTQSLPSQPRPER